jgi:hypothetical protein
VRRRTLVGAPVGESDLQRTNKLGMSASAERCHVVTMRV